MRGVLGVVLLVLPAIATRPDGLAFLDKVAREAGTKSLPSGLLYKVLSSGDEHGQSPDLADSCDVHFRGTMMDGTEFVNSGRWTGEGAVDKVAIGAEIRELEVLKARLVEREMYHKAHDTKRSIDKLQRAKRTGSAAGAVRVVPEKVIPGWRQALLLMKPGDKWKLYLKSELAYSGAAKHVEGTEKIRPGEVVVFELELEQVVAYHWWHAEGVHWWHVGIALAALYLVGCYLIDLDQAGSTVAAPKMVRLSEVAKRPGNTMVFMEVQVGQEMVNRIEIELFTGLVPLTAENFRQLCTGEPGFGYKGSRFHRIVSGFMCQGGDITEHNGTGGKSIYGRTMADEFDKGWVSHADAGLVSMANGGPNTSSSQFFITTQKCVHLDGKHVVFGRVVHGMQFIMTELDGLDGAPPPKQVVITDCGEIKSKAT